LREAGCCPSKIKRITRQRLLNYLLLVSPEPDLTTSAHVTQGPGGGIEFRAFFYGDGSFAVHVHPVNTSPLFAQFVHPDHRLVHPGMDDAELDPDLSFQQDHTPARFDPGAHFIRREHDRFGFFRDMMRPSNQVSRSSWRLSARPECREQQHRQSQDLADQPLCFGLQRHDASPE
jgi:hypothetical protein